MAKTAWKFLLFQTNSLIVCYKDTKELAKTKKICITSEGIDADLNYTMPISWQ